MSAKVIVAREVAEQEFARMCEAFRVELDESGLDDDEKAKLKDTRQKVVRDIMRGTLVVAENGLPTYTCGDGKPVTFHKPTGATLLALETYHGSKQIANTIAGAADMTRLDRGAFGKMELYDAQVCMRLATLFLQDR